MNIDRLAKKAKRMAMLALLLGLVELLGGLIFVAVTLSDGHGGSTSAGVQPGFVVGCLLACTGLLTVAGGFVLMPLIDLRVLSKAEENWHYEQLRGAAESQRQILEAIRDSTTLSDQAKQIAYRHKDREALRHAIREDIDKNDYEAAYWLVAEMEKRFGNRAEASQLRELIDSSRKGFIEREVRESLDHFDQLLRRFDWAGCQREMEQLMKLFSGHPDVQNLPDRIAKAKESHKRELLKEWMDSVQKDDVNRSVELLKQLDQYLTPGEAESYIEIARDVFKKKLNQLSAQFSLHVTDKNWNEAARIGQQIIDEFPNTLIAKQVKERMPILREKASGASVPTPS
jgi:hypothetical protein